MFEVELSDIDNFSEDENVSLITIQGNPTSMPVLSTQESLIYILDQVVRKKAYVCKSLEDMMELYNFYCAGVATDISWYKAKMTFAIIQQ